MIPGWNCSRDLCWILRGSIRRSICGSTSRSDCRGNRRGVEGPVCFTTK